MSPRAPLDGSPGHASGHPAHDRHRRSGTGRAGLRPRTRRRGIDDYLLLEAESEPGGRVRSAVTADGFTLDRGFQVLLDSYPAVRRQLDISR